MDPRFGLDMDQLKVCLDRCQEEDIVQNYNLQVTGGVNFSFTALKGTANQRTCKPTVQKSGSIQVCCPIDVWFALDLLCKCLAPAMLGAIVCRLCVAG
jgi:hypothetical protein